MAQTPAFHIYTGNHQVTGHAEDFFLLMRQWLAGNGHDFSESAQLQPDKINLILENFTNYFANEHITEFKRAHPNAQCVLMLTEFVETQSGVTSMNLFGGVVDAALLSFMHLAIARKRADLLQVNASDYLRALVFSPLLALVTAGALIKFFLLRVWCGERAQTWRKNLAARMYSLGFYHVRYLGLRKFLPLMDALVSGHAGILSSMQRCGMLAAEDTRIGDVVYPLFDAQTVLDSLLNGKKLGFCISGSISGFRQGCIAQLNRLILLYGLKNMFGKVAVLAHQHQRSPREFAYALHPTKTAGWPYSSPARIFRSLTVDGCVPVIFNQFHQHPLEDLCLYFEDIASLRTLLQFYEHPEAARAYFAPKFDRYLQLAQERNAVQLQSLIARPTSNRQE